MERLPVRFALAFTLLLGSWALLGCSDDTTTQCGAGTHLEGGYCVPNKTVNKDSGVTKKDGSTVEKDVGGGKTDGPAQPPASCGNGIKEDKEECDDGNKNNNDACLNTCKKNLCGDGIINTGVEECDDRNKDNTDLCLDTCKVARCGDSYTLKGVEECDDGDKDNTDACVTSCKKNVCGDGYQHVGVELCDDGNLNNNDACLKTCKKNVCGDGFINAGVEECDDQNKDNTDVCIDTCKLARCGDGYVFKGVEDCDDGNTTGGDKCPAHCKLSVTGGVGTVSGTVLRFGLADNSGTTVTLDGTTYNGTTQKDGTFSITKVPAGIYNLTAKYTSYQDGAFSNITVIPTANFKVPTTTLYRGESITTSASWATLADDDKVIVWRDVAGTLWQRKVAGKTPEMVLAQVTLSALSLDKKSLIIRTSNGKFYVMAAGAAPSTMVKVVDNYSSHSSVGTAGWLLVRSQKGPAYFTSPDGKTVHKVTDQYLHHRTLTKFKYVLVLGKDGLSSLPMAGGAPIVLDAVSGTTYCGLYPTQTCSGTYFYTTTDETLAYYAVSTGTGHELRSVGVSAGPANKLFTLDWPHTNASISELRVFGTTPHMAITEQATKGNKTWRRIRTIPMTGGKEVKVGEFTNDSGHTWYNNIYYGTVGDSVWIDTYSYGLSSDRTLIVVPTSGAASVKIDSYYTLRSLLFSADGKRVAWMTQKRDPTTYQYSYPVRSASSLGTSLVTHETNASKNSTSSPPYYLAPMASDVLYYVYDYAATDRYKVMRGTYGGSASTTLASCQSYSYFYSFASGYTLYDCKTSTGYDHYLHRSSTGKSTKLASSTSTMSRYVSGDYKYAVLRTYSNSMYTFHLLDTTSGVVKSFKTAGGLYYAPNWHKTPGGGYNLYLATYASSGSGYEVLCGVTGSMTVTQLGVTKTGISTFTTKANVRYLAFIESSGSTLALKIADLTTCKTVSPDKGASTYGSYQLTPDEKSLLYAADGGLRVAPLAGGSNKVLTNQGTYTHALGKNVFYNGFASSPKGAINAWITVPLAGGTAVPIDTHYSSVNLGKNDLLYGTLKYLKMP